MRYAAFLSLLALALTTSAQHIHLIGGAGYSGMMGDAKGKMDYSYAIGAGVNDSLGQRWVGEFSAFYAHLNFSRRGVGMSEVLTQDANTVNGLAMFRWSTNAEVNSAFLAVGAFGGYALDDVSPVSTWTYGPAIGLGLGWDGGRLMVHYQQAVERFSGRSPAMGLATLAVDVW